MGSDAASRPDVMPPRYRARGSEPEAFAGQPMPSDRQGGLRTAAGDTPRGRVDPLVRRRAEVEGGWCRAGSSVWVNRRWGQVTSTPGMKPGSLRPTPAVSAIALAVLIWIGLLLVSPGSTKTTQVANDVGLIVAAMLGAGMCCLRSRRSV